MLTLCLSAAFASCTKGGCDPSDDQVVNVTMRANETYSYSLGSFGDEEGASIVRQAKHYQTSRLYRNTDFSNVTYEYKPEQDYTGTDEVELRSEKGSNGASPNDRIITTTIKFRIIR